MTKTTKTISITIPIEVYNQLVAYKEADERSISYVASKAIKEFFERERGLVKKRENKK